MPHSNPPFASHAAFNNGGGGRSHPAQVLCCTTGAHPQTPPQPPELKSRRLLPAGAEEVSTWVAALTRRGWWDRDPPQGRDVWSPQAV